MVTGVGYSFTDGKEATRFVSRSVATVIYRSLLRFADAVIFHNPDDRDNFIARGFVKPDATRRINGSGADLAHFRPVPLPAGPITFVLIARLIGDKGIREYVDAARVVRRTVPDARFLLVGPFDTNPAAISREEVDGWVKEGLIEYKGAVPDVRPSIAEAHVFVLPSYREGTPKTALEAIAMARAVITTDVPGCREVVVPGVTGLLVEVRNAQAVAEAMLEFASGKRDIAAMGAAGHDFAVRKFDARQVSADVLRICGLLPAEEGG
jgi:glycosyltransferase involved in cell wall biosynthesis